MTATERSRRRDDVLDGIEALGAAGDLDAVARIATHASALVQRLVADLAQRGLLPEVRQ